MYIRSIDRYVSFFSHSIYSIHWSFCCKLMVFFALEAHTMYTISNEAMALPSILWIMHVQWHIKCIWVFFYWMHVSGISNVRTACNRFACIRLLSIYRQSINPSFLLQFDSAVDILSLMLLHSLYRQLKHTSLVQLKRWTMKRISTTAAAPSPPPPALSECKNINSEKKNERINRKK